MLAIKTPKTGDTNVHILEDLELSKRYRQKYTDVYIMTK